MLRRKLTRIQFSRDDIEEFEAVKREKLAQNKAESQPNASTSNYPVRGRQTQEERIAEVHRRIGYQPENVPADGTQRIM
jgi:hypothetical protein